jgi:hypothetical protein
MNLLFCTCPRDVYGFFTADPYPTNFAPFPLKYLTTHDALMTTIML